jgi:hypothetical protein
MQKDQMDAMLDAEKLKLDQQELQMDAQQDAARLDLELAKLSDQPK